MSISIKFENISKQYRLGLVSTRTLSHDLKRWWAMNIRGKDDPYLKIGDTNIRSTKGISEYVWALRDINLEVEEGDVLGIIGKNGAGKSTLLKLLSKVTSPTTGIIKAKGRIASLLEVGTGFHPEMTGRENIFLNGAILGMTKAEINHKLDEIVDFSGVERYIDTPVKRYSSGMMVRLGFAVAAHLDPEILVVDEVLAVGDAEFQKKAIGKMQDVSKGEGRTVLFVSHNMQSVRKLCTNGIIIDNGYINMFGPIDDCVDKYILDNNYGIIPNAVIYDNFRHGVTSMDLEFKEITLENKNPAGIATDEPLSILFKIKRNNAEVKKFTLGLHISDQNELPVGTYISNLFKLNKYDNSEFEVRLILKNHNLVNGRYKMHFTLGINNIGINVLDYDVVSNVLSFNVEYIDSKTKRPYIHWPRQHWGNVLMKDGNVQIL